MQSGGAVALAACICSMHGVITLDEYAIVIIRNHYLYIELVIGIHFVVCISVADPAPSYASDAFLCNACELRALVEMTFLIGPEMKLAVEPSLTTRRFQRRSFNQ